MRRNVYTAVRTYWTSGALCSSSAVIASWLAAAARVPFGHCANGNKGCRPTEDRRLAPCVSGVAGEALP